MYIFLSMNGHKYLPVYGSILVFVDTRFIHSFEHINPDCDIFIVYITKHKKIKATIQKYIFDSCLSHLHFQDIIYTRRHYFLM